MLLADGDIDVEPEAEEPDWSGRRGEVPVGPAEAVAATAVPEGDDAEPDRLAPELELLLEELLFNPKPKF